MARPDIVSAQVLGIRTSENTKTLGIHDTNNVNELGKTIIVNSTQYSVLVFYSDGSTEIVEGDANAVHDLMQYVPRQDSTEAIARMLEEHESKVKAMLADEVLKVFDALRPVPKVEGLIEDEAIALLREKDFVVHLVNSYPENIPLGVVYACKRQIGAPMTVDLDIRHALPDVVNLPEEEALARLRKAGFTAEVTRVYSVDYTDHHVLSCRRADTVTMQVSVEVSSPAPSLVGRTEQEALRLLEEAGFVHRISIVSHEEIPAGVVIDAAYESGKVAAMTVSRGPKVLYATHVQGTWTHLSDSGEDRYESMSAWADRDRRTLTVQLELLSASKKTHTLTEAGKVDGEYANVKPLKSSYEIKPGELFMFTVNCKLKQVDSLPTRLTVEVETVSGLFKQSSTIQYNLTLEWPC